NVLIGLAVRDRLAQLPVAFAVAEFEAMSRRNATLPPDGRAESQHECRQQQPRQGCATKDRRDSQDQLTTKRDNISANKSGAWYVARGVPVKRDWVSRVHEDSYANQNDRKC